MAKKPGKDCPPHAYVETRTVKKGKDTYHFFTCSRCGRSYMDITHGK